MTVKKSRAAKRRSKSATTASEMNNSIITDFFPIRRSTRRTEKSLKNDHDNDIHQRILDNCEEGLVVEDTKIKGRGVFATKQFDPGSFIVEYAGELISKREARKREMEYSELTEDVGCYMYYFTFKDKNYCIDATEETDRLGRLINHSRHHSNCESKLFEVNHIPRLVLLASKSIKPGDELLYDYGDRAKSSINNHPWLNL